MTMPAVARAFGKAARAKIEADLSWDAVAKKYLEMFEEARRSSEWRVAGKWWLE
jgi:glycosyltransferase involved in cell wall biosynthesis